MALFLHTPKDNNNLDEYYQRAFKESVELFIVTAFLTKWDSSLELNSDCRFRLIIGRDFGITRKAACKDVMRWLPPERKGQFMVADRIKGFHPKAVFWKDTSEKCFAIIGSSNLTRAAFETNYEANIFSQISRKEYNAAKQWIQSIEKQAVIMSDDWLAEYKEATTTVDNKPNKGLNVGEPLITFKLPEPDGSREQILRRRKKIAMYNLKKEGLEHLFDLCANNKITSAEFYEQLPQHWSRKIGNRLQGAGWEILGKKSNFQLLSKSYIKIIEASDEDRDYVVAEEIDRLQKNKVPTRRSFFSEMLCLRFPDKYPVLNEPVENYLEAVDFRPPRGASEGVQYIDLAKKLRFSLLQNPNHIARNLAELDIILWRLFEEDKSGMIR